MTSRRQVLQFAAAGLATVAGLVRPARAANGLVPFGAAVRADRLEADPQYAEALRRHCDLLVPEGGLLWTDIRPEQARWDFARADAIAAFAAKNGLAMHGHALVWYGVMPKWTESFATAADAESELTRHIAIVVGRYKSVIKSWVVVNEPLIDKAREATDLRPTIWQRRLGIEHLALAFRTARAADPAAKLIINEYDIEFIGERFRHRRAALTALVRRLVDRGVPIDGVGLQGHLKGELEIDQAGLKAFARDIKALGLKLSVTELDVVDNLLPADIAARDAAVADAARAFLSSLSEVEPLDALLTWGITDKYTWVPTYFKRVDGLQNRPLPLDDAYAPKRLMATIAEFRKTQRI